MGSRGREIMLYYQILHKKIADMENYNMTALVIEYVKHRGLSCGLYIKITKNIIKNYLVEFLYT